MIDVDLLFLVGWAVGWFIIGNVTGSVVIPRIVDAIRGLRLR